MLSECCGGGGGVVPDAKTGEVCALSSSTSFAFPLGGGCSSKSLNVVTSPNPQPHRPRFKVIMLGDWGCGKTCLLTR
jgi:hypothetical protein